jgi:dCTP deaminase
VLSDGEITTAIEGKWIGYSPYDEKYLNPASIDMTLNEIIREPRHYRLSGLVFPEIDMREVPENHTVPMKIMASGHVIKPGEFLLACTNETVELPPDIVGRVEGKSSVGRVGLAVHITAGFIDPGFEGQITLEIGNLGPWPIRLHAGMRIAQIAFQRMTQPAIEPYGNKGHYQGQQGPVESRYKIRD